MKLNGGLMSFWKFENKFLKKKKIAGLIVNNKERINTRTGNIIQFSVQNIVITFVLFKCHISIIPLIFIFLLCCEKACDDKEFGCEN